MRVAILGPLPAQFQRLQWHAGADAELILVDKDRHATLPEADLYIVWTRFVSHAATRRMMDGAGWRKVVCHRGGLATLGEVIQKWTREEAIA